MKCVKQGGNSIGVTMLWGSNNNLSNDAILVIVNIPIFFSLVGDWHAHHVVSFGAKTQPGQKVRDFVSVESNALDSCCETNTIILGVQTLFAESA